jgi:hypothetical protein
MVDAEAPLAVFAVNQSIYEVIDMTACLPDPGMGNDGPLDPHNVIIGLHHRPPPVAPNVVAQLNAEWAEVIDAGDASIDLRIGVHEAASLGQ